MDEKGSAAYHQAAVRSIASGDTMSLSLVANTIPGKAAWVDNVTGVAVSGRVLVNIADGTTKTVTIPAGLEGAPIFLDFNDNPNDYGLAGGLLSGSISGTTLTIYLTDTVSQNGLPVSYVILPLPA